MSPDVPVETQLQVVQDNLQDAWTELARLRADNERLRGLLREARPHVVSFDVLNEDLSKRIDQALSTSSPSPESHVGGAREPENRTAGRASDRDASREAGTTTPSPETDYERPFFYQGSSESLIGSCGSCSGSGKVLRLPKPSEPTGFVYYKKCPACHGTGRAARKGGK